MTFKIKKINIFINILIVLVIPFYIITSQGLILALVFLWATLHEIAHIVAASYYKSGYGNIRINLFGLSADINFSKLNRSRRIMILLSGVAVNAFLAIAFMAVYFAYSQDSQFVVYSMYINTYLVFFNLLPIIPLDGSRLLNEFTASFSGYYQAEKSVRCVSFVILLFLSLTGLYLFIIDRHNYGLLLISTFLFIMQKYSRYQITMDRVKNLIYKKERSQTAPDYETRQIAVPAEMRLQKLLKIMDYDQFHIIFVLDSKSHIIGCLTEQEIATLIENNNGGKTLKEII